jgi:hypothetical protein
MVCEGATLEQAPDERNKEPSSAQVMSGGLGVIDRVLHRIHRFLCWQGLEKIADQLQRSRARIRTGMEELQDLYKSVV